MLFFRAQDAAAIMPSVPLWPKPPGTSIPCAVQSSCHALWYSAGEVDEAAGSSLEASTQTRFSILEQAIAACSRDLITER